MLQKSNVLAQQHEVMVRKEVVIRPERSRAVSSLPEEGKEEKEKKRNRPIPITALRTAKTAMRLRKGGPHQTR